MNKILVKQLGGFLIKLFSSVLFFITQDSLNAQFGQTLTVIPPSPLAAAYQRYGDYPVSPYTGVTDINIPIYEIVSGDMVLPISISYHASGIKVTDVSMPVGLGWTLNAGGRMSRTVRDQPDDKVPSLGVWYGNGSTVPPSTLISNCDREPDLFFYTLGLKGGVSGKFMFDGVKTYNNSNRWSDPVFFPRNNLKFSGSSWPFSITDAEGRCYKYGDNQGIETSYYYTQVGLYAPYISSWLVSEILPASRQQNDKISFHYVQGAVQSICTYEATSTVIDSIAFSSGTNMTSWFPHFDRLYDLGNVNGNGYTENPMSPMKRVNPSTLTYVSQYPSYYSGTQVCRNFDPINVSRIEFKGGRVEFIYDTQNIYLQQIKVFDVNNNVIRTVNFVYGSYNSIDNRYRLDKLIIKGKTDSEKQEYGFNYEGELGHSTARDFWNYCNGPSFVASPPVPVWLDVPTVDIVKHDANGQPDNDRSLIRVGATERSSSFYYMKEFVLNKITYPTGGYTEFEYEANRFDNTELRLQMPIGIQDAGGLRIKKIKSYDGINDPLIKEYIYGINGPDDGGIGVPFNIPTYDDYVVERYLKHDHLYSGTYQGSDNTYRDHFPLAYNTVYARRRDFLSSPANEVNYFDGSSVWYTYVEEQQKKLDGTPLGKTTYRYSIPKSMDKENYWGVGNYVNSKYPLRLFGFLPPILTEKMTYKSVGADFVPVNAQRFGYYLANSPGFYSYPFFKSASYNEGVPNPARDDPFYDPNCCHEVDEAITEVTPFQNVVSEERVTDFVSTNLNIDSLVNTTTYGYNVVDHLFPNYISMYRSDGTNVYKEIKYPPDYKNLSGQDDLSKGIKNLQTTNLVSTPIEEISKLSTGTSYQVLGSKLTTYKPNQPFVDKIYALETNSPTTNFTTSGVINGSISVDPSYKPKLQVDNYNNEGDITEQHAEGNVHTSYLWGYNNMYAKAQAVNAGSNEIFFDSFEDRADWNGTEWQYGATPINAFDNSRTHTGRYSARIDKGSQLVVYCHSDKWTEIGTNASRKYKYSGWVYSNGPTVYIYLFGKSADETFYYTVVDAVGTTTTNQWIYLEKEFTLPANITRLNIRLDAWYGSGSVWFDDIRVHPSNAQMTTYTYDPLIGITSHTDINVKPTYYEYDGLGRLMLVKDKDRNILKKYCYTYAGQTESCILYASANMSGNYTSQNCSFGNPYYVNVPEGMFTSTLSQQDANDRAQQYAQSQANQYGTCGVGSDIPFKTVNQTGVVYTVYLYNHENGQWYTHYSLNYGESAPQYIPAANYDVYIFGYDSYTRSFYIPPSYYETGTGYADFYNVLLTQSSCNLIIY